MREAPRALLIGEAEVDRVEHVLGDLGVDCRRFREVRPALQIPAPPHLLVVSGPCAFKLPELEPADPSGGEPIRVCIHSQDFLPLRERLRELGFHYLVQTALDEPSLRVFLGQLLHPAPGQRSNPRLPLGGRVEVRSGRVSGSARLADLSVGGCRILGADEFSLDDPVAVLLPAALGGGAPLTLHGRVTRCGDERVAGEAVPSAVIRFGVLEPDACERLGRLVRGELIGTRVTPLAEPPRDSVALARPQARPRAASPPESADRRREVRHPYRGRVDVLELPGDAEGALGRDLSLDGVSIRGVQRLRPGMRVTLALYGGRGGAPTIVDAEVVRAGRTESALVFRGLGDAQQEELARLIAQEPAMESLATSAAAGDRIVAARVLERR